jgi:Uma2 family endonuclease
MAVTIPTFMSPQEYLGFEEKSESRYEYVDGIVYEMPGETREHNELAGNIYTALRPQARSRKCWVAMEDVKLWIPSLNRYYYPDVMVLCDARDAEAKARIFQYPCFIAEIHSPSTELTDKREKLQAYRSIESLQGYLMVDAMQKTVDYLERASTGWRSSRQSEGEVHIQCLELKLSVEAIFDVPDL